MEERRGKAVGLRCFLRRGGQARFRWNHGRDSCGLRRGGQTRFRWNRGRKSRGKALCLRFCVRGRGKIIRRRTPRRERFCRGSFGFRTGDDMKPYFSFQWHITDECDQRCRHCYIFSGDPCRKLVSMTWDEMQDTFYNCLDFCEVWNRRRPDPASGFLAAARPLSRARAPLHDPGQPISSERHGVP